jgi:hypothetical protein
MKCRAGGRLHALKNLISITLTAVGALNEKTRCHLGVFTWGMPCPFQLKVEVEEEFIRHGPQVYLG